MNDTRTEQFIYATLTGLMIALSLAALKLYQEGNPLEAFNFALLVAVAGICLFAISVIYRVIS